MSTIKLKITNVHSFSIEHTPALAYHSYISTLASYDYISHNAMIVLFTQRLISITSLVFNIILQIRKPNIAKLIQRI